MLGAYPLVAVLQLIIGPWVSTWPGVMRPLPIVPFMVFGMVYGVIPSIHRFAGGWIARGSHEAS
ncbi:hypothetical protein EYW49_04410 [Siculibacillus lacustris]|uniref:Uncharacterized protein n=2 Tax=Siculibacillus lacustris TaxID=1549641 RepID=A0A4Q9VYF1_9HYPH|nr:hypothetical protein EYW49_04410 [Siculibacillus lacustris]